ncbi:MAG: L-rhamnose mutarotase [Bacteroidia bacterium]|nr:MAG: L-rhamnose mutarotase [Bacteroidia bacterium]
MKRVAFKMYLKEGYKEEYRKRHNELWPEVSDLLKKSGISEYSIFLDERTHALFAVQTVSHAEGSQSLGHQEIIQKWWDYMSDIMEVNPDNSPVSEELESMFYLK